MLNEHRARVDHNRYWLIYLNWTFCTFLMISPSLGHRIGCFLRTLSWKSKHRACTKWPQLVISGGRLEVTVPDWNIFLSWRGVRQNMQRIWDVNLSVSWRSETCTSMQFLQADLEQFILQLQEELNQLLPSFPLLNWKIFCHMNYFHDEK